MKSNSEAITQNVNDSSRKTNVVAITGVEPTAKTTKWNSSIAGVTSEMEAMALDFLTRFIPLRVTFKIIRNLLAARIQSGDRSPIEVAGELLRSCFEHLLKYDEAWKTRLSLIFKGAYPVFVCEVIFCGTFACKKYKSSKLQASKTRPTYSCSSYDVIGKPSGRIMQEIAASLYELVSDEEGPALQITADVDRLKDFNKKVVPRSGLIELVCPNRPLYRFSNTVQVLSSGVIRCVEAARPTCSSARESILSDWADDLAQSFAWDSEGSLANFLAYLIQPLLVHLSPGGFSTYFFSGPPGAGKTALASGIPSMLYYAEGQNAVVAGRLPKDTHQFQIYLAEMIETVYVIFDEIVDANHEQMKNLDQLATARQFMFRKLHKGYGFFENHLTIGLTAVDFEFSTETSRRVTRIELKDVRTPAVQGFFRRWEDYWPELLAALLDAVNKVDYDWKNLREYPKRPKGFGLLGHFVKTIFDLDPDFTLADNEISILDLVVEAFETGHLKSGTVRAPFTEYSITAVLNGIQILKPSFMTKNHVEPLLKSSLPYRGNTENDPALKEGLLSKNGKRYHIKYVPKQKEGDRVRICIKEVVKELV